MLKEKQKNFEKLQQVVDLVVVTISWWIAYYIRFEYLKGAQQGLEPIFLQVNIILVLICAFSFIKSKLYTSYRFSSRYKEIFAVIKANSVSLVYLTLVIYFIADNRLSRLTIIIYFIVSSILLVIERMMIRNTLRYYRRKGYNLRYVTLVGNNELINQYLHNIKKFKDCGVKVVDWIQSEGLKESTDVDIEYFPEAKTDFYVVSFTSNLKEKENEFLRKYYNDVTPIQILPDLSYSLVGHEIDDFDGVPILAMNQPKFSILGLFIKRLVDTVITGIGLIIISPLMLFLMIGVKLSSPGPIFYGQERVGRDGKTFNMWKFRSMKLATKNEDKTVWTSKDDPRITAFGNFIRKTSLDELPQLWNVIVGEMSLVGPRPERTHFVEQFKHEIPNYMLRHKMKAGITGWAQVNGLRGDTDLKKRIEFDIYYIKNWSIFFDVKIIFLTFIKGFVNPNAY